MAEPADRWRLAYISYLVLGTGTLLPWNVFITAADYFESQFPGRHADRLFTICYLPINLLVLLAIVRHHSHVRPVLRIVGGFVGFTVAVSAVPLMDAVADASSATFGVILGLVALCGVCDGFAQGALFGDAATLPPRFTQALVSGTGISGVAVCLLRILTKATLPDTPEGLRASASVYFTLAAFVCATCIVLYALVVPRLPVVQYHRRAAVEAALCEAAEWGQGQGGSRRGGAEIGEEGQWILKRRGSGGVGGLGGAEDEGEEGQHESWGVRQGPGAPGSGPGSNSPLPWGGRGGSGGSLASPERLTDMLEDPPHDRSLLLLQQQQQQQQQQGKQGRQSSGGSGNSGGRLGSRGGGRGAERRRSADVELALEDHFSSPSQGGGGQEGGTERSHCWAGGEEESLPLALPLHFRGGSLSPGERVGSAASLHHSYHSDMGRAEEGPGLDGDAASMQQALLQPPAQQQRSSSSPSQQAPEQQQWQRQRQGQGQSEQQVEQQWGQRSPRGCSSALSTPRHRSGSQQSSRGGELHEGGSAGGPYPADDYPPGMAKGSRGLAGNGGDQQQFGQHGELQQGREADYRGVLRQLWRSAAANVVIYTVTLSIFPGVLAEDVSSARLGYWYPVALITAFNIADWAGKAAPGVAALRLHSERAILGCAGARALFLPAFHLAASGGAGLAVVGLLTLLLGFSNGYLTSCAMIGAPERVPAVAAPLAGNLMVLSLVLGLCIGAACGFLWLL